MTINLVQDMLFNQSSDIEGLEDTDVGRILQFSKHDGSKPYIQSAENRRKEYHRILVTLTSRSDSNFERSDISLKENKRDGDSNGFDYCVRKNKGKVLWFSVDCIQIIHTGRLHWICFSNVFSHKKLPRNCADVYDSLNSQGWMNFQSQSQIADFLYCEDSPQLNATTQSV